MYWLITDRGDDDVRRLIDGEIDGIVHYSRQTKGARMFTRNGQSIVLIAYNPGPVAAWVSFRPTPGKAVRQDKRDAIECALFKLIRGHGLRKATGGAVRSSHLIREATDLTRILWGDYRDGVITFIRPEMTTAQRAIDHPVGWSYRMAGWIDDRPSSDGKPCLRAPEPAIEPAENLYRWMWSGRRGGSLREIFESSGVFLGCRPGPIPAEMLRAVRLRGTCPGCEQPGPLGACDICDCEVA